MPTTPEDDVAKSLFGQGSEEFLNSLDEYDLPDDSKPKADPQQAYAENAKQRKALEKIINDAAEAARAEACKNNPAFREFKLVALNRITQRRDQPYTKVIPAIGNKLLVGGWADKSQKAVLEAVQVQFPQHTLSANIWTWKLQPWAIKKIEAAIKGSGLSLSIKGCTTLSSIKKAIQAARKASQSECVIKTVAAFSKDAVVINKITYPITIKGTGKYSYPCIRTTIEGKRAWVRVDHLMAVLSGA